jgi:hypothetical protein
MICARCGAGGPGDENTYVSCAEFGEIQVPLCIECIIRGTEEIPPDLQEQVAEINALGSFLQSESKNNERAPLSEWVEYWRGRAANTKRPTAVCSHLSPRRSQR